MNSSLLAIEPHSSKRISEYVAQYPDIVDLTVGVPSFGPPSQFRRALADLMSHGGDDAAPEDRYAHSRGVAGLRAAIAKCYRREKHVQLDPDTQILVTNGAVGALWMAILTATGPGDEVLLPDPCYMIYAPLVTLLGRRVSRLRTTAADGFRLDESDLPRRIGQDTRLLVLNSPANPTGTVYGVEQLRRLCEIAGEHGIRVVHDEVLDRFAGSGGHTSALAVAPAGVAISVNSLSKRFGMTGWRIGWLSADPPFVAEAAKAHTFFHLAVSHAAQRAASVALADESVDAEVARHASEIQEQGARFVAGLRRIPGLECSRLPDGGFYAFVDVRALAARSGLGAIPTGEVSTTVAEHLMRRARVATVPGTAFGPEGEGFVRISLAAPADQLDLALDRLASGT